MLYTYMHYILYVFTYIYIYTLYIHAIYLDVATQSNHLQSFAFNERCLVGFCMSSKVLALHCLDDLQMI